MEPTELLIYERGAINTRQHGMQVSGKRLNVPKSVAVVGLGGVGAWVALDLALTGVERIVLIDFDRLEAHNLNRTPYKESQIGMTKVEAMAQLIHERRGSYISIFAFTDKYEKLGIVEKKIVDECTHLVDCRDTVTPEIAHPGNVILGGYDGSKMTIHVNPKSESVWGEMEHTGYTITPSWLVPPQLLACMITTYLCVPALRVPPDEERIKTVSVYDFLGMCIRKKIRKKGTGGRKVTKTPAGTAATTETTTTTEVENGTEERLVSLMG